MKREYKSVIGPINHHESTVYNVIQSDINRFLEENTVFLNQQSLYYHSDFLLNRRVTNPDFPDGIGLWGKYVGSVTDAWIIEKHLIELTPVCNDPRSSNLVVECYEPLALPVFVAVLKRIAESFPEGSTNIEELLEIVSGTLATTPAIRQTDEPARDLRALVPKTLKARRSWILAYKLMTQMDDEYKQLWEAGDTDDPEPSPEDYADRLKGELGINRGERTIRNIKSVGDAGFLKQD